MKLYYIPESRATRPRWLLEELGVPYELVRVPESLADRQASDYVKIHPHGRVPAIVDGEMAMFESAAICLYVADKYLDKGLAPALDAPERGPYLQWVVYSMVTLEPPVYQYYRHTKGLPQEKRSEQAAGAAKDAFGESARALEKALGAAPFVAGKDFTAADVMIGATLYWARNIGLLEGYPGLQDYVSRISARPAFVRSRAD